MLLTNMLRSVPSAMALSVVLPVSVLYVLSDRTVPFRPNVVLNTTGISVLRGQQLFAVHCQVCHSLEQAGLGGMGPNLHNIGVRAATRRPGMDSESYLLESIVDPNAFRPPNVNGQMPQDIRSKFTTRELRDLVGFLASLGRTPDLSRIAELPIPEPTEAQENSELAQAPSLPYRESVEHGFSVFTQKANCASCHALVPRHPFQVHKAPSLYMAGSHDSGYLHRSIVDPNADVSPGYELVKASLLDGRVLTGRFLREDEEYLWLLPDPGSGSVEPIQLLKADLEPTGDSTKHFTRLKTSPMPSDYRKLLSDGDIQAIIAMLQSLSSSE